MPRPELHVATRPSIIPELQALWAQLQQADQTAYERRVDIGEKLLVLATTAERKTACRVAGIHEAWRTVLEWIQVARNRDLVTRNSARSINQAIKMIRAAEGINKDTQADGITEPLPQRDRPLVFDQEQTGCIVTRHDTRVLVRHANARVGWCEDDDRVTPDTEPCPTCGAKPRS